MLELQPKSITHTIVYAMTLSLFTTACGPDEPTPNSNNSSSDADMSRPDVDSGCTGANCPADQGGACGNGMLEAGEQCDDGNTAAGDGCDATCQNEPEPECGNSVVEAGEDCDAGTDPSLDCEYGQISCEVCNDACALVPGNVSRCGDGVLHAEQGELCDLGEQNSDEGTCLNDCTQPSITRLIGGGLNTYALMSNGSVYGWGDNAFGQLGLAPSEPIITPQRLPNIGKVTELAGGAWSSCALNEAGEVWCIGRGEDGELGNGAFESSTSWVQVQNLNTIQKLEGVGARYCVLDTEGQVFCWGNGGSGALGIPNNDMDQPTPVQVMLPLPAKTLTLGLFGCVSLTNNQTWCWGGQRAYYGEENGNNDDQGPEHVMDLDGAQELIAVDDCLIFKANDGDYYGVGDNRSRGLNLLTAERFIYVPIPINNLTSEHQVISDGNAHVCAISPQATLACWGEKNFGQISEKTLGVIYSEVPEVENVKSVGPGARHTCALDGNDEIWCWGSNAEGQLGLPLTEDIVPPTKVDFDF